MESIIRIYGVDSKLGLSTCIDFDKRREEISREQESRAAWVGLSTKSLWSNEMIGNQAVYDTH